MVPVTVTRSLTANLPEPVNSVDVDDIVCVPPLDVKLMSVPDISVTWDFAPDNVVLVCAITLIYCPYVF